MYHTGLWPLNVPNQDNPKIKSNNSKMSTMANPIKSLWKFLLVLHLSKTMIDRALAIIPKLDTINTPIPWIRYSDQAKIVFQSSFLSWHSKVILSVCFGDSSVFWSVKSFTDKNIFPGSPRNSHNTKDWRVKSNLESATLTRDSSSVKRSNFD